MSTVTKNLIEALANQPEFLRSNDLIELGLFKSFSDVSWAKKRGLAPPHIQIGDRKIMYLKKDVINWVKNSYKTNEAISDEVKDDL